MTKTELEIVRNLVAIVADLKKRLRRARSGGMAEDFVGWLLTRYTQAKSCLQVTCGIIRRGHKKRAII
jgi:hypothetical protein